jgi:hypothetical protein
LNVLLSLTFEYLYVSYQKWGQVESLVAAQVTLSLAMSEIQKGIK